MDPMGHTSWTHNCCKDFTQTTFPRFPGKTFTGPSIMELLKPKPHKIFRTRASRICRVFEVGPHTVSIFVYIPVPFIPKGKQFFKLSSQQLSKVSKKKVESQNSPQTTKSISKNVNEYVSKSGAQKFTYGLSGLQLKWKISRFFLGGEGVTMGQLICRRIKTHLHSPYC